MVMAIHEECGVFGIMSTRKENVAGITYYGLYALQHRGQEKMCIRDSQYTGSDLGFPIEDKSTPPLFACL